MSKPKARTLGEFVETYDKSHIIPKAIRKGLAELGPKGWEPEADFIKRCQVSTTDFAKYRGEFADHCVDLPSRKGAASRSSVAAKRAWCGSKDFAATLRDRVAA